MIPRVDKRTPIPSKFRSATYRGYSIVEKYKYLSVEFDDKFSLLPDVIRRAIQEFKLKKMSFVINKKFTDAATKYHL